jgi:hypothetical protein
MFSMGGSMKALIVGAAVLSLGACAYQAQTVSSPARNVVTSYTNKVPGKWLLYVEADRLNTTARPEDVSCSAHSFPLDFSQGFPASVRDTLPNVLERVEEVPEPVASDRLKASGARGIVIVRGEQLSSRLRAVPGFWSANIVTEVDMAVSVTVEGPNGRMFGKTFDGRGKGDRPSGAFCSGGSESLKVAAEDAQREVLRRIAEEVANSDRVRSGR